MTKQAFTYTLKIWFTALGLGPVMFLLYDQLSRMEATGFGAALGFVGFSMFYGFMFSIPSWLVLWLCAAQFTRRNIAPPKGRLMLTFIAIALTILPFVVLFSKQNSSILNVVLPWSLTYAVIIIGGIWLYKYPERGFVDAS